jgi:hypothetical protein
MASTSRSNHYTVITAEVISLYVHKREHECSFRTWIDVRRRSWPCDHDGQAYPVKYAALQNQYNNLLCHLDGGGALHTFAAVRGGRPRTLTVEEKEEVRRRVQLLARNFTSVTWQMFGMEVDAVLCKRRRDETDDSGVKKRFLRGGGARHLRALKKELNISFSRAGKAMEKERAMANQPETRLNYYRLILHQGISPVTQPTH